MHIFEKAGLGQAPFRFVGCSVLEFQAAPGEPVRAGGSCDYCPAAIKQAYWLESADGKRFKVGSSCIDKSGDRGLVRAVKKAKAKAKRIADAKRIKGAVVALLSLETRQALRAQPHAKQWRQDAGETALNEIVWLMRNAGTAGRIRAARVIEKTIK